MIGKTYVILGGNGVFGVHTALYLLRNANPRKVICIGRNPQKGPAFSLFVDQFRNYEYHQVHIVHEQDRLFTLFDRSRPEVIINFAALAYATSWESSWRYYDTNIVALAKMCEALGKRDYLERWIQIGSSEIYGSNDRPVNEDAPIRPSSPYAVSKACADMHLMTLRGFPWNILRPSNCYGPGQQAYRVLPRAVMSGLTGKKFPLQGGGIARKSWLHAKDLARAVHLLDLWGKTGKIYNVGPDESTSIRALVEMVAQQLNMTMSDLAEIVPGRIGEDSNYLLDSSAIKADLKWSQTVSLQEGIRDMIEWGRVNLPALREASTEYTLMA